MKVQVELDDEIADQIVRKELKWHLQNAKEFVHLHKDDKKYFKKLGPALEIVCEYFGVNTNDKRRNK